jgi:dTDP-4-amino-4,6-dideoxygalactose transaminase
VKIQVVRVDKEWIDLAAHYLTPAHLQRFNKREGFHHGQFFVVVRIAGEILSLPIYPFMPGEYLRLVDEAIHAFPNEVIRLVEQPVPAHGMLE